MTTRSRLTIPALLIAAASLALASGCANSRKIRLSDNPVDRVRIEQAHAIAYEAAHTRNPDDAIRKYGFAVEKYKNFPAAWNNMGVLLMKQGQFMEAETAFAAAAEFSQSDARPMFNRGLLWMKRHYPADARVYFRKALERDPNYLPALRGAVQTDVLLRDFNDQTLENIRRALMIEKDPKWLQHFALMRVRVQAELKQPEAPAKLPGEAPTERELELLKKATKSG